MSTTSAPPHGATPAGQLPLQAPPGPLPPGILPPGTLPPGETRDGGGGGGGGPSAPPGTVRSSTDRYIWQEQVRTRCRVARTRWQVLRTDPRVPERVRALEPCLEQFLEAAEAAADTPTGALRHRHGGAVECAWGNVHAAEALLLTASPQPLASARLPHLQDTARAYLHDSSAQRKVVLDAQAVAVLPEPPPPVVPPGTVTADLLGAVLLEAFEHSAADHIKVRSFRNVVLAAAGLALLVVVGLVVMGALAPRWVSLCATTSTSTEACLTTTGGTPGRADIAVVAIIGAAAGVLSGIASIRHLRGTATPFEVPTAMATLKAPAGALSAVLGVVLLKGAVSVVDVPMGSVRAVLAWAVVLGASQQLVTRFADRQARTVLDVASSETQKTAPASGR